MVIDGITYNENYFKELGYKKSIESLKRHPFLLKKDEKYIENVLDILGLKKPEKKK